MTNRTLCLIYVDAENINGSIFDEYWNSFNPNGCDVIGKYYGRKDCLKDSVYGCQANGFTYVNCDRDTAYTKNLTDAFIVKDVCFDYLVNYRALIKRIVLLSMDHDFLPVLETIERDDFVIVDYPLMGLGGPKVSITEINNYLTRNGFSGGISPFDVLKTPYTVVSNFVGDKFDEDVIDRLIDSRRNNFVRRLRKDGYFVANLITIPVKEFSIFKVKEVLDYLDESILAVYVNKFFGVCLNKENMANILSVVA